jgi:hypothetical protein
LLRDPANPISTGLDLKTQNNISQESLQILSLGSSRDVEFLTVSWPHGQLYRKKLGLDPKDFHVTVSKVNNHNISKDVTTTKGGYPVFLKIFQQLPETAMDFILADLLATTWQQDLCLEFLTKFPVSYKAMIRIADCTHGEDSSFSLSRFRWYQKYCFLQYYKLLFITTILIHTEV